MCTHALITLNVDNLLSSFTTSARYIILLFDDVDEEPEATLGVKLARLVCPVSLR
jgi:hypothetical protein